MLGYQENRHYSNRLQACIYEFDVISREIESKYEEHERKRLSKRRRQRDVGAGRSFKLKVKERFFLMLLVYYRLYITHTYFQDFCLILTRAMFVGILYACLNHLSNCLCVPLPSKLYKRTIRLRTIDEVEEEYFPGFKAFIDSSEQEIPRPKSKRKEQKLLLW